ncbi:MAG: dicarboxylate/amino acid:cation symporter [bacterium]
MTKFKFPLHYQIVVALVFGAIFGVIFSVNQHKLGVEYRGSKGTVYETTIENWKTVEITDNVKKEYFGKDDQLKIIKSLKAKSGYMVKVYYKNGSVRSFENVKSMTKVETPATMIKPIGDLFIRLLSFLAIPLVLATLIAGAASLGDIKKLGRVGGRTLAFYLITTAIAIIIGIILTNVIRPGERISRADKSRLCSIYEAAPKSADVTEDLNINVIDFIVQIVPKNPFQAIATGQMLQLIFFAVMFGMTLTFIDPKKSKMMIDFFEGAGDVMIKMVGIFMKFAPFGVFALIAVVIADFGFNIMFTLFLYMFTVVLGLFIHQSVVYSFILKVWGKYSVRDFYKHMRDAQLIAFSTSSSAATLPLTMDGCAKMGVPKDIASFVLPLGATINMDGTALLQGVAAVFIAQVYGMELSIVQQITIVFTAVLASIGTAPVPGVGIIMLVLVLESVGIPIEGIALIIGVDRILDMLRTITNISGDAAVAVAVTNLEKRLIRE